MFKCIDIFESDFGNYYLSCGHLTPPQTPVTKTNNCIFYASDAFKALECKVEDHVYPGRSKQFFIHCNDKLHTRMCNTQVNLRILKTNLKDAFDNILCNATFSK
jgi:hypothetical protein